MRRSIAHITVCLTVLLSIYSCGREAKVIPRKTMAKIYAEMFVMDQRIAPDWTARRMADTSSVYGPILESYGYTPDDFRASMEHYINDPDRYARILRQTSLILDTELKRLKKEKERLESLSKIREEIKIYHPERIFFLTGVGNPHKMHPDSVGFYIDSSAADFAFDSRIWLDTVFYGPRLQIASDTLSVADTLFASDSGAMETPPHPPVLKRPTSKSIDIRDVRRQRL